MLSSSNFVSPENNGALMQHQPSVNSPATPACASHTSSVSADGIVGVTPNAHADEGSIPQSVKGAPEHLRPVIRKRQNSESARRSRQRRKVAAKAFYERFDDQCKRLAKLETKVATLAELVRRKREREAEAERECELDQDGGESPMHEENVSAMQVDDDDEGSIDQDEPDGPSPRHPTQQDASRGFAQSAPPGVACHERYARDVSVQESPASACGFGSASSRIAQTASAATVTGIGEASVGATETMGPPPCGPIGTPTLRAATAATSYVVAVRDSAVATPQATMRKAAMPAFQLTPRRMENARPHGDGGLTAEGGGSEHGTLFPSGGANSTAAADVRVQSLVQPMVATEPQFRADVPMGAGDSGQGFGFVDTELDQYFADTGLPSQRLFSPC